MIWLQVRFKDRTRHYFKGSASELSCNADSLLFVLKCERSGPVLKNVFVHPKFYNISVTFRASRALQLLHSSPFSHRLSYVPSCLSSDSLTPCTIYHFLCSCYFHLSSLPITLVHIRFPISIITPASYLL